MTMFMMVHVSYCTQSITIQIRVWYKMDWTPKPKIPQKLKWSTEQAEMNKIKAFAFRLSLLHRYVEAEQELVNKWTVAS